MSEGGQGKLSDGSTLADEFAVTTINKKVVELRVMQMKSHLVIFGMEFKRT